MPEARVEELIISAAGTMTIEVVTDCFCTELLLSVTVAVKLNVPAALGVPVIVPDDARLRPVGSAPPVIDQL